MAKKETTKTAAKKATTKKSAPAPKQLRLLHNDEWLQPFAQAIEGRHQHVLDKMAELTNDGKQTLTDFASGYPVSVIRIKADCLDTP